MKEPKKITYIAGVPRSGSSWLGQILNSSPVVKYSFQPLFAYEFKDRVDQDSKSEDFKSLLNNMYVKDSKFLNQIDKQGTGEYPIFQKNSDTPHLVFKEVRYHYLIEPMMRCCKNIKLIGIIRNPNAAINSWIKTPKEFPNGSDPLAEWRFGNCKNNGHEDFFGYYKWKEVANLYIDLKEKWPERVYVLSYEELVQAPKQISKDLFEFCKIDYTKQTDEFLERSTTAHIDSPYAVFKDNKVVSQWKIELNPYITKEIKNDITGTRLERFIL